MCETRVAVYAFDGISPFHLSVPCMVFNEAAQAAGVGGFCLEVFSLGQQAVSSAAGFSICPQYGVEVLAQADIVVVPSWPSVEARPDEVFTTALRHACRRGATVVGLCTGAYALAYAGLLDGQQATTHWAYLEDFHRRFPAVDLSPDVLYVQRENVITSAGTAAAIDCCLQLVRDALGSEKANRVARMMVTAPHRSGGQAQFIDLPLPETVRDQKLAQLMQAVAATLAEPHSTDSLARQMAMSRRTFTRRFRQLTGQSVGEWLLQQRLRYCQQLLERSDRPLEQIADLCGFQSVVTLRHHFRQRFKVSPSEWRRAFVHDEPASL